MLNFTVRTPEQLIPLFAAFRKRNGLSQAALARLIGVSQQTVSQLERSPNKATLERLLRAFAAMDVEIVVRERGATDAAANKVMEQTTKYGKADW
jgi:HTH-type transcriptional regulator / antitoxin HipB